MAKKSKKAAQEAATLPSEEPTISSPRYLSGMELAEIKIVTQDGKISKLNSENLLLKIKNTEFTILNLQSQLDKLKADYRKSLEIEKASSENSRQNMVSLKSKYGIKGSFAYDPISGEIFTE